MQTITSTLQPWALSAAQAIHTNSTMTAQAKLDAIGHILFGNSGSSTASATQTGRATGTRGRRKSATAAGTRRKTATTAAGTRRKRPTAPRQRGTSATPATMSPAQQRIYNLIPEGSGTQRTALLTGKNPNTRSRTINGMTKAGWLTEQNGVLFRAQSPPQRQAA